jgi:hypothetical protein
MATLLQRRKRKRIAKKIQQERRKSPISGEKKNSGNFFDFRKKVLRYVVVRLRMRSAQNEISKN